MLQGDRNSFAFKPVSQKSVVLATNVLQVAADRKAGIVGAWSDPHDQASLERNQGADGLTRLVFDRKCRRIQAVGDTSVTAISSG